MNSSAVGVIAVVTVVAVAVVTSDVVSVVRWVHATATSARAATTANQ